MDLLFLLSDKLGYGSDSLLGLLHLVCILLADIFKPSKLLVLALTQSMRRLGIGLQKGQHCV